jgi:RimJ/RimL family protein N-acetyltransferase
MPVGRWILEDLETVQRLTEWRKKTMSNFFTQFEATPESMQSYLDRFSISQSDRILFVLRRGENIVGHLGLSSVSRSSAEVDNVMKSQTNSEAPTSAEMVCILEAMLSWAKSTLGVHSFRLQVMGTNVPAINLYEKAGFHVSQTNELDEIITSGPQTPESIPRVWMERVEYS